MQDTKPSGKKSTKEVESVRSRPTLLRFAKQSGGGSGEVKAESNFGRGSKFTFTLPLKHQESKK